MRPPGPILAAGKPELRQDKAVFVVGEVVSQFSEEITANSRNAKRASGIHVLEGKIFRRFVFRFVGERHYNWLREKQINSIWTTCRFMPLLERPKGPLVQPLVYLATRAFWRRMISANPRRELFTASALGNTLATSGSRTTTLAP